MKIATGLQSVSGAAYLRQAEQVLASDDTPSSGTTHPETFIRVHALRQWAEDQPVTAWDLIDGPLDVDGLDLLGQARLESLTCALIADLIRPDWFRTDAVVGHARLFASQVASGPPPPPSSPTGSTPLAESTRRYLAYVLLDFATVDPDLERVPLVECFAQATRHDLADELRAVACEELGLRAKDLAELLADAAARLAQLDGAPTA